MHVAAAVCGRVWSLRAALCARPSGGVPRIFGQGGGVGLRGPRHRSHSTEAPQATQCLAAFEGAGEDAASFRGIVFVKERVSAHRVVAYIQNEPTLAFVRPSVFIGHSEMTSRAQEDVRSRFDSGELNLLVATSVAEEGLNVRAVKMAVMLDSVYSGRSLTQCKGRIRMAGGIFHVLCFRREREAAQRSEQQVEAATTALRDLAAGTRGERWGQAQINPLATLNEMKQRRQIDGEPLWTELQTGGGQADFVYKVQLVVQGATYVGQGRAPTKKEAKANAAAAALAEMA